MKFIVTIMLYLNELKFRSISSMFKTIVYLFHKVNNACQHFPNLHFHILGSNREQFLTLLILFPNFQRSIQNIFYFGQESCLVQSSVFYYTMYLLCLFGTQICVCFAFVFQIYYILDNLGSQISLFFFVFLHLRYFIVSISNLIILPSAFFFRLFNHYIEFFVLFTTLFTLKSFTFRPTPKG